MWRKAKRLRRAMDVERIERAIAAAERTSTGEVRVSISPWFWGDVRRRAEQTFERLGMSGTRQRNGVLIFLVPSRRQLVVLGDEGIHLRVGQAFWDSIAAAVGERFQAGDFTGGLVAAIDEVARQLREHFPRTAVPDDNELSDAIDFGAPRLSHPV